MKPARRPLLVTLVTALCLCPSLALAKNHERPRRAPPPEALEACAALSEGAACTVSLGDRELQGLCRAGPDRAAVACLPDRPEHGRRGPRGNR